MKPLFIFLLLILVGSCSYLPDEELILAADIKYEETTEYIKLSPKTNSTKIALIFIPGGLVDPHSYTGNLEKIARTGNTVFILKVSANLAILEISKSIKIINLPNLVLGTLPDIHWEEPQLKQLSINTLQILKD